MASPRKRMKYKKRHAVEEFTVLGHVDPNKTQKVHRVLPSWLANPVVITTDLNDRKSIHEIDGLDHTLIENLEKNNFPTFFPVQSAVIPWLIEAKSSRNCLPMRDVCVSAPTGSGKTLAYVIPILNALKGQMARNLSAIVLLPVRDLALQVHKVFIEFSKNTGIKIGTAVGDYEILKEIDRLLEKEGNGYRSKVDIIVATPGRLVDHLNKTKGFSLQNLKYLVIDEADQIMNEVNMDCLKLIDQRILKSCEKSCKECNLDVPGVSKFSPGRILSIGNFIPAHCYYLWSKPQKLLFSATLSQDPEKLKRMNLFQPKLFTSIISNSDPDLNGNSYIGKFTTPAELKERFIRCNNKSNSKPLVLYYLIKDLNYKRVLCFTNTTEEMRRLHFIMKDVLATANKNVQCFCSYFNKQRRKDTLRKFDEGKIDLLISTDIASRGIDFHKVKYVVSYSKPAELKTYIHRIGRTARAGKKGTAVALLLDNEVPHFLKLIKSAGKDLGEMNISDLEEYKVLFKSSFVSAKIRFK